MEYHTFLAAALSLKECKEAVFFQCHWELIKFEVLYVLSHCLQQKVIPKAFVASCIHLISKIIHANSVANYRPISCCDVIYKILSKVLASRLQYLLPINVNACQGGFFKGRSIVDNVLICHELVRGYGRKGVSPRMLIMADLRKAYDSLSWDFLESFLLALQFPPTFVQWVMLCVRSPWYSLNINGSLEGSFQGKVGLRQGDPISPMLFVIAMEVSITVASV